MLNISNLSLAIQDKKIIDGITVIYQPGSLHIIMGSNGSGKSSFLYSLMGHPFYQIQSGIIAFENIELQNLTPDKRARLGMFLVTQEPIELPGVSVISFLSACYKTYQSVEISIIDLVEKIKKLALFVGLSETIIERNVHEGFSGGEKKRFELLQMLLFLPKIVLLDEIDSGLDISGLALVVKALEKYRQDQPDGMVLMITHHLHMLELLPIDTISIIAQGSIVQSGGQELVQKIIDQKKYETK
jgi:Fe-S cluster assembly ATP-binding protein